MLPRKKTFAINKMEAKILLEDILKLEITIANLRFLLQISIKPLQNIF